MRSKVILFLIIVIGFTLRLYKLDARPAGFTWDEAALGYNAYSLLKTARDEHGALAPVIFKSFGDYKPGLYVYFTVPSVAIFGLSEFSTRLPSAIFGTLLILLIYALSRQLLLTSPLRLPSPKLGEGRVRYEENSPLAAALLLAISPLAVHFSRGAWEANLALLLTTLASVLYLRRSFTLAVLFFGLTFWSYQGAKLFTPLILTSLFMVFKPKIGLKQIFYSLLLLLLTLTPILLGFSSQSGRLKVFNVFSYTRSQDSISGILRQDKTDTPNWIYYLWHSESLDQFRGIVERYLNHFSPRFLFVDGDWSNSRHSTPYQGYLYYPEILILVMGICLLIKKFDSSSKFILFWLLLAPLPSAFSRDIVSGVRSLPMIIPLVVISGIGLAKLSKNIAYLFLFSCALLIFLVYYLDLFYVHSPHYSADSWLYPYKPALQLVKNNLPDFNRVIITNTLGQPYIFTLFYYRIDPTVFQQKSTFVANQSGDVGEVTNFDKFYFQKVDWPARRGDTSTLIVGNQYELPDQDMNPPNLVRLGEIYLPNGIHALRVVGLK